MNTRGALLLRLAGALDDLVRARTPRSFERLWEAVDLDPLAWRALAEARGRGAAALVRPLAAVDRRLLRALRVTLRIRDVHVSTFRVPALERMQHASAAALTGARWGPAGLITIASDRIAPITRRYYAFLGLAELRPPNRWPFFRRYLTTPTAHHAFVAGAIGAAAFYGKPAAAVLVELFRRIRTDEHRRRFLGPRILQALYRLGQPSALPFLRELLTIGHPSADIERCEVTWALVIVRQLTGVIEPSVKFGPSASLPAVTTHLDRAETIYQRNRGPIPSVALI